MALGERRKLAREAREQLSLYLIYLLPHVRKEIPVRDAIRRRRGFLLAARDTLDALIRLDADVAEIEEQEVPG